MSVEWTLIEHLPIRKLMVRFDGTNGPDIAALIGDPDRCEWQDGELVVKNSQGWFRALPGNPILHELDGSDLYTPPAALVEKQYRILGPL